MIASEPDDVSVQLVQTGGFAGLQMSATVPLADLPVEVADRARELSEHVATEGAEATGPSMFDAQDYQLVILRNGQPTTRVDTRDGSLTAAQKGLIDIMRPYLKPVG